MSRTLPVGVQSAIAGPITQPNYLVSIDFATPVKLATSSTVTAMGFTWVAGKILDLALPDAGASLSGQITLANHGNEYSALILNSPPSGRSVQIWDAHDATNPVLIFTGQIDSCSELSDRQAVLEVSTDDLFSAPLLRTALAPPLFNFIPPAGQVIQWGRDKLEVS